ncbi:Interleukin-28B [Fukomys damarensis]|uniref:Interleukin-28B n=2 Tax=Fukomys damarensis TaxID=885580 RepID=A0A091CMC4_FUKDA|nr:Interleukin-28B [Fukomys damarensis]
MAQYRPLLPEERQAFNTAKDVLGKQLLRKGTKCNSDLFRAWDLRQLQVWERHVALQAELTVTLEVLSSVTDPALWEVLKQPIHALRLIHAQWQACVPSWPKAGGRTYSHRLHRWLQRLKRVTQESPGCLQTSVISNLFRLLTRDLR